MYFMIFVSMQQQQQKHLFTISVHGIEVHDHDTRTRLCDSLQFAVWCRAEKHKKLGEMSNLSMEQNDSFPSSSSYQYLALGSINALEQLI